MVRVRKVGWEPQVSTFLFLVSRRIDTTPYRRAGVVPGSQAFESLLKAIYTSSAITLHGFYCHTGDSYGSTGLSLASHFLSSEVQTANEATKLALDLISSWSGGNGEPPKFVLSVGSTPTAHSASADHCFKVPWNFTLVSNAVTCGFAMGKRHGTKLTLLGNYPMLDLQQLNTGLIKPGGITESSRDRHLVLSWAQRGRDRRSLVRCGCNSHEQG